jgi:hypothetical protein
MGGERSITPCFDLTLETVENRLKANGSVQTRATGKKGSKK